MPSKWSMTGGSSGGPACVGNHRFCKCHACVHFKHVHKIKGDFNIIVDGHLDEVFEDLMSHEDILAFRKNSEKFAGIMDKIFGLGKEDGGLFWGLVGLNAICTPVDVDTELSDLLREFIQQEKSSEEIVARLIEVKEVEVAENAEEKTFELLAEIRSMYYPAS